MPERGGLPLSRALRATALLLLVLGSTALVAAGAPEAPSFPCVEPQRVPGVGVVCPRGDGLLDVYSPSGRYVGASHGPDPVPADETLPAELGAASTSGPFCVDGAAGTYHVQVIYARAFDDADGYASWAPRIRSLVDGANALLVDAGRATGSRVDLLVKCLDGIVGVKNEVLPTPRAEASFSTIASDLAARGHNDGRVKYWILYDDRDACACGGMGNIYGDARPGPENANNGNARVMYAITFGYESVRIMLHELGHNLGAVQNNAPRTSGGFHCIDGRDTMCYDDGGWNGANYSTSRCISEVFDCGKDDYFNVSPEPGSYLATSWNLGSRANRYLAFDAPRLIGVLCDADVEVGAVATCLVNGTDGSAGVRYRLDWGDGSETRVPETGYEPAGVIRQATHRYTSAGTRTVTVDIADSDGNQGNNATASIRVHEDLTPPALRVVDPVVGRAYRGCGPSVATPLDRVVWVERGCVRVEATDARGVERVDVRVAGVVRASMLAPPYEAEVPIPRGLGANALIEVLAYDAAGNVGSFTVRGYVLGS